MILPHGFTNTVEKHCRQTHCILKQKSYNLENGPGFHAGHVHPAEEEKDNTPTLIHAQSSKDSICEGLEV